MAFGFKYDIATAAAVRHADRLGEPAAAGGRPGPERPDHEWRDLWPLPEVAQLG